jgi:hypothetical protein
LVDRAGRIDYDTIYGIMDWMNAELLCPCEFQLVLVYNPEPGELFGREVEPEVLGGIFSDLKRRFGNYTPLGTAGRDGVPGGSWEGQVEPSVRIEIAVPEDRIPELERFVGEIGVRLKQEAMYFKIGAPCVKIIKVRNPEGKVAQGG